MKNNFLIVILSISAGSAAYAGPVCKTLEDCRALQTEVAARIEILNHLGSPNGSEKIPDFSDFARNADGGIRRMRFFDAEMYCQDLGFRLPTIRELATWAQQYGAIISEVAPEDTDKYRYREIHGIDGAGAPDHFYYNFSGYIPPTREIADYAYWSKTSYGIYENYALDGDGPINDVVSNFIQPGDYSDGLNTAPIEPDHLAVRCVRSRK